MTVPKPFDERQARKQFVRRRQKLVFTITVVVLVVAMVFSLLFALGDLGKTVKQSVANKPNYGVAVPCAPSNSTYVNHPNVTIRVLNGTDKSGLGTAVMEALNNDGFSTQGAADFPSSHEFTRTEIRFGKNGIANAYTVSTEFSDAILRMDDRSDKLVDVIVGSTFNNLKKTTTKTASGQKITSIEGCVTDPSTMKNLPKASSHTAVN
ncbi:LytR C-terminal domain-containing protein [Bifidobacterium aquikefiri]|uniref:LytR cell envelope-related transcriptional attenuator n=1 Tax=Bifidobacterium aquikefiri TaxID=1653207 RepID=A0A261GBU4_9BIFI|nr:LytR C-terminal domain-containing protein [Bifidobacterium aquikefiri]OZG68713.1 LytR cell envelope-related transcriptional attenuator [Bifidobacterium aquikefiri]